MPDDPAVMADVANALLRPSPCRLTVGRTRVRGGPGPELAVLTIRTESTTLTVFLSREECLRWAALMTGNAESMSVLLTGNGVPA